MTDTLGLVVRVKVHSAGPQDRESVPLVLEGMNEPFPRISHAWVDQGYTRWESSGLKNISTGQEKWFIILRFLAVCGFFQARRLIRRSFNAPFGFRGVLPRRWIVERTFAWFSFCRRLCKDYELLPQSSENWIYVCMTRLMTRRLARASP